MNLNRQNRRRSRPKLYKRRWFQILFLLFTTPIVIAIFYSIAILKSHQEKAQSFDLSAITKLEVPSRIYDRKGTEIGQIKIEDITKYAASAASQAKLEIQVYSATTAVSCWVNQWLLQPSPKSNLFQLHGGA